MHAHPDRPDGLLYLSRYDPDRHCVGIFDRVAGELEVERLGPWGARSHLPLLAAILDAYDFALIE